MRTVFYAIAIMVCVRLFGASCAAEEPLTMIAFGSCARQDRPQPIWDSVLASKPQGFILVGDNIYGDTQDMSIMRAKYAQLAAQPGFQKLRSACPVWATWDDHDFGANDAGVELPSKVASQKEFLTFYREPVDSPRWKRPGVYDAKVIGPPGKRVQIILLDTRYFRDPLETRPQEERRRLHVGDHQPTLNTSTTILGETQWKWLEAQLRQPAEVRIVVSSIQVVSTEHGWETWGNFPHERDRLFKLIADTKAGGVVFISGDRHIAELSRSDEGPYPFYDLTSSGLNQRGSPRPLEPNSRRIGQIHIAENFGTIAIEWAAEPGQTTIRLRAHDLQGKAVIEQDLKLNQLQPHD